MESDCARLFTSRHPSERGNQKETPRATNTPQVTLGPRPRHAAQRERAEARASLRARIDHQARNSAEEAEIGTLAGTGTPTPGQTTVGPRIHGIKMEVKTRGTAKANLQRAEIMAMYRRPLQAKLSYATLTGPGYVWTITGRVVATWAHADYAMHVARHQIATATVLAANTAFGATENQVMSPHKGSHMLHPLPLAHRWSGGHG